MKEERIAVGGAVVAAVAASLCCIGPLLFVMLGAGAFGAAGVFETARPYLLGAAALLLAVGFYRTYFRRDAACAPGEACAIKSVSRASRAGLWIASVAVLAFALSPYYVGYIAAAFIRKQPPVATTPAAVPATGSESSQASLETITVEVENMDCTSCEVPIRAALEKTPGVRAADVSYQRGVARVSYDPRQTDINQIKRAISSTGYKAR
ncbi:MAG: cation transporter [Acidobacteria bacterium]|nr:cation transporter [Acidobacteriota bacterium]